MTTTWRRETVYANLKGIDEREEKPQMKPTSEILERISKSSKEHNDGVFTRLYRYLLREDIYMNAYRNLYANNGAATKGIDNDTVDGFSLEYIRKIINDLKNQTYEPKPVRRTYIPKRNGKIRPLGIPSFRDKLVQEVIREILEPIYEPVFSDNSHGFRPNRSCHTAFSQISKDFRSTKWFIEGDIKGCFENIAHKKLLEILDYKIKDSKFINLIGKFLKAGYLEQWKYHNTYSGTPQGGILSPILANIYLHEFDCKIHELKRNFDKPSKQNCTTVYGSITGKINRLKKKINDNPNSPYRKEWINTVKEMQKRQRKLPYKDNTDKKLVYIRYADDFLVGISGTKEEAKCFKQNIKEWLSENLALELSDEKTKITHSSETARFLGYDISVRRNQQLKRKANGVVQRTLNNSVELIIPLKGKVEAFLFDKRAIYVDVTGALKPRAMHNLLHLTDLEILDTYNAQTRGICNYYSLASNFNKLNYFVYLMEYSCLKTLACRHKSSVAKIIDKYRYGKTWAITYSTKKGMRTMEIVKFKDCKRLNSFKSEMIADIDSIKTKYHNTNVNTLDNRLRAEKCELCGKTGFGKYEIHHINKVKNLKGKFHWERIMIARRRKTLVVCKECHIKIHQQSKN